ncbi:nitrite reductase small subunit NirD [Aestuariirhabdus sp. Z084]|uniref:nitrite reductase small subunit NirD n=1 Tax=Aestuariirhabdus haliotis TaxID=2918751 RepID=UPI00201B3611|nr:nitrite reductase small subunit NirD [Aestuariirhabdus haliotis]MCL6416270.1 nitrite reductase small subunit NirD [Aestuariirhabdus haliotis]MCL6420270.1 nitrite reductase small subunit NirD [Aestuariirhabdus haliotis]
MNWKTICELEDIDPNTGVCALVNGQQVAVFRLAEQDQLFAIGNYDPAGKANVLSRGLIAQLNGITSVASPLYKHHFCLSSGICQEDTNLKVPTYEVRVQGSAVEVAA